MHLIHCHEGDLRGTAETSHGASGVTCACYRWTKERGAGESNAARKRGKRLGLLCGFLSFGFFTRRDLLNWKESDAEGDRKAMFLLGQKGSVLGRAESGELLRGRKQRRQF